MSKGDEFMQKVVNPIQESTISQTNDICLKMKFNQPGIFIMV